LKQESSKLSSLFPRWLCRFQPAAALWCFPGLLMLLCCEMLLSRLQQFKSQMRVLLLSTLFADLSLSQNAVRDLLLARNLQSFDPVCPAPSALHKCPLLLHQL
jgi:hypothetical protein